jgi:hypothetical protein
MEHQYAAAGIEPPLEELLDDQIARLVMRRDGIGPADVWRSVEAARMRLARKAPPDTDKRPGLDAILESSSAVGTDSQLRPPSG